MVFRKIVREIKKEPFSYEHLHKLMDERKYNDADDYVANYFYKGDTCIFYRDNKKNQFISYGLKDVHEILPNDLKVYKNGNSKPDYDAKNLLKSTSFFNDQFEPIINFHKDDYLYYEKNDKGYDMGYMNMAKPQRSFETVNAVREDYEDDLKMVYDHIKKVWANDDNEMYDWIMNFNACTVTGKRKLRKCLYLPCDKERAGRGSILTFFNNILGERMFRTSSSEDITKYTKMLEGRCCINIDDMPVENSNKATVSEALKKLISDDTFGCRNMRQVSYTQKNTFNIYITSQYDCILISESNNKRYVIADINTCYVDNHKYFTKLNKVLHKPEVQKFFYEDMIKLYNEKYDLHTLKNPWNEDDVPHSKVKAQKLIASLPRSLKWIKEKYILNNKDINETTTAFFRKYYDESSDRSSRQNINKNFKKIGLLPKKKRVGSETYYYYTMSAAELYNAFDKREWIDKEIDLINNNEETGQMIEGFEKEEPEEESSQDYSIEELQQQMEKIQAKINKKLEKKMSNIKVKDNTDENKKVIKEYLNIESTEKKKKKKRKKRKLKKTRL